MVFLSCMSKARKETSVKEIQPEYSSCVRVYLDGIKEISIIFKVVLSVNKAILKRSRVGNGGACVHLI